ncbi:hypothetical protein BDV96DRAFT_641674 [Lophiotrema nucula]|uniref:NmrA-like domain-containing protein n=1 Tax=Lophiotrema nucula TaxID=690887 RepID=A0A6A5ZRZ1_9PLEO|nr:hypothetical protein BDV96DRAFT_641674 [Lophiotrema nucula]
MATISLLLVGATGVLGKPILDELVRQKTSFARIAILTTPERAHKFEHETAEVVVGSLYDPLSYNGFTHVISAVGNDSMILQPVMVEAAVAGGVRHYYASEWNSDIAQREIHNMRYFRDKQAVRAYLRGKASRTPGFQFTLMVTGIFSEWAVDGFYGFDHDQNTARLYGSPDKRVGITSIPDIARYTVDSLHIPFQGSGRTIRVQGWTGTVKELIAILELARGKPYRVTYLDNEEAVAQQEDARMAGNDLQEMMASIRGLLASGYGVADGIGPTDNHLFDASPEQPLQTFQRVFSA